jgi:hypothetical protein
MTTIVCVIVLIAFTVYAIKTLAYAFNKTEQRLNDVSK